MKKHIVSGLSALLFCSASFMYAAGTGQNAAPEASDLCAEIAAGLKFRNIGPAVMSGRISDIAIHPTLHQLWYVAAGSGGVWKTENGGTTWTPIFDAQNSYSIGCISIDPVTPDTVWVGTGENVSGRHVGFGDGVYKSLNGGKTWSNMGLPKSEHIARIVIDPRHNDTVYVAAEGPLWSAGGERGVYKTTDGGKTWTASLAISPNTGVASLEMDPANSDILYAAAYQRRRTVAAFMGGGPESAIYKSTDAGKTWRKLTVGLPAGDMGKIGLAVSPQDARVVYATIEANADEKGFYRSANRGESFEKRNSYSSGGTGPHYYQEIFADPNAFDRVYQMDPAMQVTADGGFSFHPVGEKNKHGDNHAMAFIAGEPDYILNGSDGGVYETRDRGKTWRFFANLPVTQFYKIALDNALPFYNVHGGTQDNGSQLGPSRTLDSMGIGNCDWLVTMGADGYASAIDPVNPDIMYVEWQEGNLFRFDKKSHESVAIIPRPAPDDPPLRFNWDAPILISPQDHTRIYYAAQFLWSSPDQGSSWQRISPDLTRHIFRLSQPIMGKTWSVDALWDHNAMSQYGTITTISQSPLNPELLYAGTDDGLIQVTENGGKNWRKIDKLPGVPDFFFVNKLRASNLEADTVYATLDNHKSGDYKPYVLKSGDRGKSWSSIAGDLPKTLIVWSIVQDKLQKDLLFIASEFGIYATVNGGAHWFKLSSGVPTVAFRDIAIQERECDLVGASFGRGIYILDDYSPLRQLNAQSSASQTVLFPVKKALSYMPLHHLNEYGNGCQGDNYFLAPNPAFGAVFSYYLSESLLSAPDARREDEQKRTKAGEPVTFPGWDALRAEDHAIKPEIILLVKDAAGQVVRTISAPTGKGLQRVAWDLRHAALNPIEAEAAGGRDEFDWTPKGPLAVPGQFSVTLAKKVNGVLTVLAGPQPFTVESLGLATLEEKDKRAVLAYQTQAADLQRAMLGAAGAGQEALTHLRYMKTALRDTQLADASLEARAIALERKLQALLRTLQGDWTVQRRSEMTAPSLIDRVSMQVSSTCAITETVKRDFAIAAGAFGALLEELRAVIEREVKQLGDDVEAAGAPWSPGRGVPHWKNK